jgi:hypothetical protein
MSKYGLTDIGTISSHPEFEDYAVIRGKWIKPGTADRSRKTGEHQLKVIVIDDTGCAYEYTVAPDRKPLNENSERMYRNLLANGHVILRNIDREEDEDGNLKDIVITCSTAYDVLDSERRVAGLPFMWIPRSVNIRKCIP